MHAARLPLARRRRPCARLLLRGCGRLRRLLAPGRWRPGGCWLLVAVALWMALRLPRLCCLLGCTIQLLPVRSWLGCRAGGAALDARQLAGAAPWAVARQAQR